MADDDREQVGETEVERPPIQGVDRSEITIPHVLRLTCVECVELTSFDPDRQTDSGVVYVCPDCGHEVELTLDT